MNLNIFVVIWLWAISSEHNINCEYTIIATRVCIERFFSSSRQLWLDVLIDLCNLLIDIRALLVFYLDHSNSKAIPWRTTLKLILFNKANVSIKQWMAFLRLTEAIWFVIRSRARTPHTGREKITIAIIFKERQYYCRWFKGTPPFQWTLVTVGRFVGCCFRLF